MAKYKAEPFYSVHSSAGIIHFDHVGEYETINEGEIAVLSGLCPRYLICVDEGKAKVDEPKKAEEAPKPKAPAKKSSGK
ncbi:hypothetical protein COJ96_05950 [Bacillus sp. AFS073361]|uniref:hypothetical protein n=1 Tax=Bacillus sp. AFS073361 TaxID=2033511 RepID=UPI000BF8F701|nr:hypothetical protein [Bacillus sp. AFS073361]PFP30253.1 hypothetical protein COJ96_05950 [Bacillus sp. AFS073361]